jgi:SAM-dependent methyltransferase
MIKLHLGCGHRDFGPEWIHIDGGDYPHLSSHDITKLDFEDNTVDLIYASHVIEYFDREEVIPILREWKRVLKPGGILRLSVPDFDMMACLYRDDNYNIDSFLGPLFGKMRMGGETIYHKTVYDYAGLQILLLFKLGFYTVRRYDWKETEHAHIDDHSQAYLPHMDKENGTLISLNIEAIK